MAILPEKLGCGRKMVQEKGLEGLDAGAAVEEAAWANCKSKRYRRVMGQTGIEGVNWATVSGGRLFIGDEGAGRRRLTQGIAQAVDGRLRAMNLLANQLSIGAIFGSERGDIR